MRVVVFGGSGWIGRRLVARLRAAHDVLAPGREEADLRREDDVRRFLAAAASDAVVNLAAAQSGADGDALRGVNVEGARRVAAATLRPTRAPRLVHVSTDLVHDGRSPPYADDAPAAPLSDYGRTKAAGEEAVLALRPDALVVRTSLVVCADEPDRFTAQCLARLAQGGEVRLFTDEVRSALTRDAFADAVAALLRSDASGRMNVAASRAVTRHELGTALLRRFGAGEAAIARCVPARAAEHPEPRPLDLTLDVSRAEAALGRAIPPAVSAIRP